MKKPVLSLLFILMFIYCSPRVTRIHYDKSQNTNSSNCNIIIKENVEIDEAIGQIVGSIKIDDTGFSMNCGKTEVILILTQEACALGADIISINKVKEPGFVSSCFRVEADFIKLNEGIDKTNFKSSPKYSNIQY